MTPPPLIRCLMCGFDGRGKLRRGDVPYRRAPRSWRNGVCAMCVDRTRRGLPIR